MQYYFDLELTSPEGNELVFNQGHHDGYVEATDFAALAASGPKADIQRRITQIRSIFRS